MAEFISAMAAGNCSRIMVDVCENSAGPTTLALIAAAHQTGGRVICIVPTHDGLHASKATLGESASSVDLVVGEPLTLFRSSNADVCSGMPDFVLVDCKIRGSENVLAAARRTMEDDGGNGVVVGYNAMGSHGIGIADHLLPIGGGLRVSRGVDQTTIRGRGKWVIKVDESTGEEHVYRITAPSQTTANRQCIAYMIQDTSVGT